MNSNEQQRPEREAIELNAAELDGLAKVPDDVLAALVGRHGLCLWEITYGDPPTETGEDAPDRELAARLCAGCPVRRECLEFELRTAGENTVGVWGGLNEDDRRALHAVWRTRAGRAPVDDTRTDDASPRSTGEPVEHDATDEGEGGQP